MSLIHQMLKYGNFVGGGNSGSGGGGVQPDWNQNDPTKPDYVKNRPFWTEDPVEKEVLTELSVQNVVLGEEIIPCELTDLDALEADQVCIVTLDGVEYECTAYDPGDGTVVIGNGGLFAGEAGTGEPFCVCKFPENTGFIFLSDNATHIISIKVILLETRIEPQYFPVLPKSKIPNYDCMCGDLSRYIEKCGNYTWYAQLSNETVVYAVSPDVKPFDVFPMGILNLGAPAIYTLQSCTPTWFNVEARTLTTTVAIRTYMFAHSDTIEASVAEYKEFCGIE